jgi:hypothetical protein
MTCHARLSPPAPPTLTAPQRAFLALHAAPTPPHTWRWHFAGSALRATSEGGCATIWADDLDALVAAGLLAKGPGCADCYVTDLGRDALQREEA